VTLASSKVNGPDLIDCEALMRAIESLHEGKVVLTVFSAGIGGGTGLQVNITHILDDLTEGDLTAVTGVSSAWPCGQHREFWACIFEGLYKLDYAIGQSYHQQKMPQA
jgi:hypothetical protein